MLRYTAKVTNKDIVRDMLTVQVEFRSEDDSHIINDAFSTKGGQDENWLQDNIDRKCKELEQLSIFKDTISLGEVNLVEKAEPTLTAKEEYRADLATFSTLAILLRNEVITSDNVEYVALKKKLQDNFNIEYIKSS